jgi:hypothetical protein
MASTSLPQRLGNELTPWDLGAGALFPPTILPVSRPRATPCRWPRPPAGPGPDGRGDRAGRPPRHRRRRAARPDSVDTDYADETFKHILLPVWMAAYKYNGKSYRFLVNAQSGKVQGERPWSARPARCRANAQHPGRSGRSKTFPAAVLALAGGVVPAFVADAARCRREASRRHQPNDFRRSGIARGPATRSADGALAVRMTHLPGTPRRIRQPDTKWCLLL